MLEKFVSTIQIAWVAGQISARHRLKPPPTLAFHHPLVETLVNELNGSVGVFVHWGVYESGKSTAVREAAWRLQENAMNQVIKLQSFDFHVNQPIQQELRRLIGVPADMSDKPISEFFIQPDTTLVIDHADQLMRDKDRRGDEMLEMVRGLIKESEATQKFNVLLVVTSWERAKELVDAGCKLVPGDAPARWTREQIETLFATASEQVREKVGERKDKFLRLTTLSGTPGFLTYEAFNEKYDSRHAAMHDIEWCKGIKALYNTQQETPEWWPDTPAEGRFPDRNGIYHHKDLAYMKYEM